jgi:hypothetical protein
MRRISSKWTFFHKRVFPLVWFGFLVVFIGIAVSGPAYHADWSASVALLIVPLAMMGVGGYFLMKKLVFDLADEVWDDGAALLVKNAGQEQRIALGDVKNVEYSPWMSPPRVVLQLRRPTIFGDRIAFCAPMRLIPLARSPVIDDLIDRIDAARQQRT